MMRNPTGQPVLAMVATVVALSGTAALSQSSNEPALTMEGLSGGTVVEETRAVGDTYFKGTFDDWSLRCIVTEDGNDPCQMYQLLSDGAGSPIAEFTMFRLPEGAQASAGATIVAPLETSLEQGLTIKVDDAPARRYPFAFCNTVGCYARIGLTDEDVDAYRRGSQAIVRIVPIAAPDQNVNVGLSLKGFTAAFDAASVIDR
ncbi:MAG: invasion associated locus B family protein [Roseobacter sp.]